MSLAFLVCVERGYLEAQTELLCQTIRRFAGRFRDVPIHAFQPRKGKAICDQTQTALEQLGVIHHTAILNSTFDEYAVGNKIFVCDWAEKNLKEDVLVFLDSDTIVVDEPTELALPNGVDAAIRPADSVLVNSTGPGHQMEDYWLKAYDLCGVRNERFVHTELGRRVRAYFSAGLIAVRRSAGVLAQWKTDFLHLTASGHFPRHTGISRMDEISLSITLTRMFDRVQILDERFNYLIYRRLQLAERWRNAQLSDLVHIHYRNFFSEAGYLGSLRPGLDSGEIYRWLERRLPLTSHCH